ncbi:hypothetical protein [Pontixanthobacter luteolus]|uniref:hypothetical protein n=1 Tax=Pontixanthobacter luteolus TaxID=295089 RepID=UPI002303AC54|nr:hypothetical protein [Pontixanthobacter luteolus]
MHRLETLNKAAVSANEAASPAANARRRVNAAMLGGVALAAMCCPAAALAQEAVELPQGTQAEPEQFEVTPSAEIGAACGTGAGLQIGAGGGLGQTLCPYADTSAGLDVASRFDLPGGDIRVSAAFARGTDESLTLDRQMQSYRPGFVREGTLASLGMKSSLFDENLKIESEIGWSRNWETPIAATVQSPARENQTTGFAQAHKIDAKLIDGRKLGWTVSAEMRRASDDYRLDHVSRFDRLFAAPGSSDRIRTTFRAGDVKVKASFNSSRFQFTRSQSRKLSLSYAGVGIGFSQSDRASIPNEFVTISQSRSRSQRINLEFDLYSVAPLLAMEDTGFKSFLPKHFSVGFETRHGMRFGSASPATSVRKSLDVMGLWTTPIGDSLVNFTSENTADQLRGDSSSTQFLVSHSFNLGDWAISGDAFVVDQRSSVGSGDQSAFYSASASYRSKGGPKVELRLGQDQLQFGDGGNDFTLRDSSVQAELRIDMSPVLQRKLQRDDMHLALEMQVNLNNSDYEVRYLDEVIDAGSDGFSRKGVMLTFAMDLR